jgi:hypothetical protein
MTTMNGGLDFFNELERLDSWCSGRKLTDEQNVVYWQTLGHIPHRAFKDIISRRLKSTRPNAPMPSPDDLLSDWNIWRQEHPSFVVSEEREAEPCRECGGSGLFHPYTREVKWMDKSSGERRTWWSQTVVGCPHCSNYTRFLPKRALRMSKREIAEAGWHMEDPNKATATSRGVLVKDVKSLAKKAIKEMPTMAPVDEEARRLELIEQALRLMG